MDGTLMLKISRIALSALLLLLLLCGSSHAQSQPFLHPLFSENAVLQRDRALTVWGWTKPETNVVVKFDGQNQTVHADARGRWSALIAPHAAGGPHSLEVAGADEVVRRKNLLFGDVWLCSGQSNMSFPVSSTTNAAAEIAAANFPQIRLLSVPRDLQVVPVQTFGNANWKVCSPQTVGSFSAVAYFFGRKLNRELKIPIGLIDASWGGTHGESWASREALETMGDFKTGLADLQQEVEDPMLRKNEMAQWWKSEPGTKAGWQKTAFDDATWKSVNLPGRWEKQGFADFDGTIWSRKTVEVPANWAGHDLTLNLGTIDDNDTTYWNGELIGSTMGANTPRVYRVPGALVKAGRNVLAVAALDIGRYSGIFGPQLSLQNGDESLSLNGSWKAQSSVKLQELPAPPRAISQNTPSTLFNGMIAPLLPAQIKGVIWYQGEANANSGRGAQYRRLLPTLIRDWRAHFSEPLPFYIVQLPGYRKPDATPSDDKWPPLREAQLLASRSVPDTGLAVTIDVGEEKTVHPHNKQTVGLRLALSALKQTYGFDIQASGPTFKSVEAVGDTLQLTFDHAQDLNLKGDANRVFAIAGADKKFHWATPKIEDNIISLSSPAVPSPQFARFGWSDNPRATLYNAAGLPASPFRTDAP